MRVRRLVMLAVAVLAATGLVSCSSDRGPEAVAREFAAGLPSGHLEDVALLDGNAEPITAEAVYSQAKQLAGDLNLADLTLTVAGDVAITDTIANVPVRAAWKVRGQLWTYQTAIRLMGSDDNWRVRWAPSTLQAQLRAGDKLRLRDLASRRASILDAQDQPLITERPVVIVGIQPSQVKDRAKLLAALATAFAKAKVNVSLADLPAELAAAKPDAFVEVVTLRREVYDLIRADIHELPGTVFREQRLLLAPTRAFARALLGTVGEVQKDQLDANPGVYAIGDVVGQSGLQEQYDRQLRGIKGFQIVIAPTSEGEPRAEEGEPAPPDLPQTEVFQHAATAGEPIKTTLDQRVQKAADAALATQPQRSALVAVRISDGAVLAVANGPDGGELNLAFTASVPPGSTFKMVSALSLLSSGAVTGDTPVACPKTFTVDGRTFKNAGDFALGSVPFHTDFARSCNTAFAALAPKLGANGLDTAAKSLGIGTGWQLGMAVTPGSVQVNPSAVESAAASFGQGQTVVSPVVMAAATAAVARGSWTTPTLLRPLPAGAPAAAGLPAPPANGTALNPSAVAALKAMMREVVTAGTATALADVRGGPVFAKTGTAEYDNDPAHTHAWTVGWQGDIAFAVFVEKGGASSATAVPIVESFLAAL